MSTIQTNSLKMIKKIEVFTIICDSCCHDVMNGLEHCGYNDIDFVELTASESGFEKIGDSHFCPDCFQYNEDFKFILTKSLQFRMTQNVAWFREKYPTATEQEIEEKFQCKVRTVHKKLTELRKQYPISFNIPPRKKQQRK